jgi:hypothetical protein
MFEFTATAGAIAMAVGSVLQRLLAAGARPVCAVTDNGANLVLAFNPEFTGALETWVGTTILRESCIIHTSNLMLDGVAQAVDDFDLYKTWVGAVMAWLRTRPVKTALRETYGVTEKVVVPQEAKWNTYEKGGIFIQDHWDAIAALAEAFGQDLDPHPEYSITLDALVPFARFTERIERVGATLGEAYRESRALYAVWDAQGTEVAATMKRLMAERLTTTADAAIMELAYTLQPNGHAEYLPNVRVANLPDRSIAAARLPDVKRFRETRLDVRAKVMWLANFFFHPVDGELPTVLLGEIAACYDRYLQNEKFWQPGEDVVMGWGTRRALAVDEPSRIFCSVAEIVAQTPASEAAAERLISVFECLFTKQRMGSEIDLIDAEMMIRMWQIYRPDEADLPALRSVP